MCGDRVSLYLTQYVVQKRVEDNRNHYPLLVAMIPDKCAWMIMTSLETKDEARGQLRELLGKAGLKYGVDFGGLYGEGAHYIKMEQARYR